MRCVIKHRFATAGQQKLFALPALHESRRMKNKDTSSTKNPPGVASRSADSEQIRLRFLTIYCYAHTMFYSCLCHFSAKVQLVSTGSCATGLACRFGERSIRLAFQSVWCHANLVSQPWTVALLCIRACIPKGAAAHFTIILIFLRIFFKPLYTSQSSLWNTLNSARS